MSTNLGGFRQFSAVIDKLDGIETDVRAARVVISNYDGLSDGAKQFLGGWNAYLAANAERIHEMRRIFVSMRPVFKEFNELLRAVYDTARLQSITEFDRVRRRVYRHVIELVGRSQTDLKNLTTEGPADRRLAGLLESDQEAQAIVAEVNERYPRGSLAEQFD